MLLRDDKSYPLIFLSADEHPRLAVHRGAKHEKGEYFGPFPNSYAVRETLALLQKLFPVRQCENSVYRNRSRPCLQYQIGRCSGPCVEGLVSEEEYQRQVDYVRLFLSGKDQQVLTQLITRMEEASQQLHFEDAARIRDQIQAVRRVTEQQFVSGDSEDLDVIGVAFDAGPACVHVLFIRLGKVLGSRSYFPKVPTGTELSEVVQTLLGSFTCKEAKGVHCLVKFYWILPSQKKTCWHLLFLNWLGEKFRYKAVPEEIVRVTSS